MAANSIARIVSASLVIVAIHFSESTLTSGSIASIGGARVVIVTSQIRVCASSGGFACNRFAFHFSADNGGIQTSGSLQATISSTIVVIIARDGGIRTS